MEESVYTVKLLITLITYNRLAYTKRTLASLFDNISDDSDYFLIIVDNNSTDGTQKYLKDLSRRGRVNLVIFNPENVFPGKACNIGWAQGLEVYDATHLMRLDNDMQLTREWDVRAEQYFEAIPELGQLGLEHEAIEEPRAALHKRTINGFTINEWPGVVGGPMIMKRKMWDLGMRYDETPWEPPQQEDSRLSQEIKARGYLVGHAQEELGRTFANKSNWVDFPEYYQETFKARGIEHMLENKE